MSSEEEKRVSIPVKKVGFIAGGIIILILLGIVAYFFLQSPSGKSLLGQSSSTTDGTQVLVAKVGRLIELPTSETPTIATVSDVSKLKGQPFFANAQNGDQVLIYKNAKKAILYRPSIDKIIEVGPVNLTPQEQTPSASSSASTNPTTTKVNITILNGTTTVGLTKTAETQLTTKDPSITVVNRDNAVKQDYPSTIVVDLTGKNAAKAAAIAASLKGKVGSLPAGETKPDGSDILVILGKDFVK